MSNADENCGADFAVGQCLLVHNLPKTFSEIDTRQLLQLFDPISIEFLVPHRAVYAKFSSQQHARDVLAVLHQQILDGKRLYVEYAEGNARDMTSILKRSGVVDDKRDGYNCASVEPTIGDVMRKLYATADNLNFKQPPPPHLRYNYPLVNRDIIDAISIALETSRKFYVQVLHLMNRMNLEPPFVSGDKKLKYEPHIEVNSSVQQTIRVNVSTQTEEIAWQNFIRKKRKRVASDESELESDDDDEEEMTKMTRTPQKVVNDQIALRSKHKHGRMLKMQRIQMNTNGEKRQTIDTNCSIKVAFDSPAPVAKTIKIIAPKQLQPIAVANEIPIETNLVDASDSLTIEACASNAILTDAQINENRIPVDQLKTHPLFQNYVAGAVTNRLYIKNIAKEVTEEDLKAIYHRYLERNSNGVGNVRSIDIRLMQTGRMKGQAFVTFTGPYLDSDDHIDDSQKYQIITKALNETNGLIVKSKVLVVTYGKKK